LVLDLKCFGFVIFFNRYFGFVFRFVNFVPKGPILFFYFFEKIKTCPKTGPKPKLNNSFQTAGYKIYTPIKRGWWRDIWLGRRKGEKNAPSSEQRIFMFQRFLGERESLQYIFNLNYLQYGLSVAY
jgi:hypothetical protein